jgi:hypothetical protein
MLSASAEQAADPAPPRTEALPSASSGGPHAIARPRSSDDPDFDPINIFYEYENYLAKALQFHARGMLAEAAVYAGVAAHVALRPHPGFFTSPRLERLLVDIGRQTRKPGAYLRILGANRKLRSILHVATELPAVGGITNMLARWIAADKKRMHSVAMTGARGPVHDGVADAVSASGGDVHRLNKTIGGPIQWAQRLRTLARQHDAIVLHVYSQDIVPSLAFAETGACPPVLLLNHGDHLFWLGAATSDVVINLRDVAQELSIARRGVEPRRNVMVPTMVAPAKRTRSREQAKQELGLAPDSVFLFSAARAMKYRSVNGRSFADSHVDLLRRNPNAVLWVLGAGDPEDWRAACASVGGRMRPLPESPDTKVYYEAADIYVDSFPFVSSTSMMEAAGMGAPLVSRFYGPKEARIFAINHPGIDAPTLHGASESEYLAHLDHLIQDSALRAAKGEEARASVLHYHTPPSWLDFIEKAYQLAAELPPIDVDVQLARMEQERYANGEPDRRLHEVFGYRTDPPHVELTQCLGVLPLGERIALWRELRRGGALSSPREAVRGLLPDWLVRGLKS